MQIIIFICGNLACGNNIIITGLRKGFNPMNNLIQNIQITTEF